MRALVLMMVVVGAMVIAAAAAEEAEAEDDRALHQVSPEDARIIAAVSTWTQLSFVTTTTTVLYTCLLAIQNTLTCKKRRLRKYSQLDDFDFDSDFHGVESSLSGPSRDSRSSNDPAAQGLADFPSSSYLGLEQDESNNPTGKLAITVWSSFTSTYTMSMTSTNSATTFSVSFLCTVNGASYPPACG